MKILTSLLLTSILSPLLLFSDTNVKIKTNPLALAIGALNIKSEINLFDNFSIEPVLTLMYDRDEGNLFPIYGVNSYYYFNGNDKNSYFITGGVSIFDKKSIDIQSEKTMYNGSFGYQMIDEDDIAFSFSIGFISRDNATLPMLFLDIGKLF